MDSYNIHASIIPYKHNIKVKYTKSKIHQQRKRRKSERKRRLKVGDKGRIKER